MHTRAMLAGATGVLLTANIVALAWLLQQGPLPAPAAGPSGQTDAHCPTSSVFPSLRDAAALAARIGARGGAARVLAVTEPRHPDYLVYLGPHPSRGTARRALRELEGSAIDGHIIGAGELANAVAVGVFSRRDAALARREQVAAAGYEANLLPIDRALKGYAVVAEAASLRGVGSVVLPCPAVVSAPPSG